jgi:hypothetical protein
MRGATSARSPAVEAGAVRTKVGTRGEKEPAVVADWIGGDFFDDNEVLAFCGAFCGAFCWAVPGGLAAAGGAGALAGALGAGATGAAGAGVADGVGPIRPGRRGVGKGISCASTGAAPRVTRSATVAASTHVRTAGMLVFPP